MNSFDTFKYCTSYPNDKRDTVTFGKGQHIFYWNPKTKSYMIWERRNKASVYIDTDYSQFVNGNHHDVSKLLYLITHINEYNILTMKDKKTRVLRPVMNRTELAEICKCNATSGHTRAFIKGLFDNHIIKYDDELKCYFLNPLVSMGSNSIYIHCYKLFREEIKSTLTPRAIANLDRHLEEECGIKCLSDRQI